MNHVISVALKTFLLGKEMKSKKSPPFPLSRRDFEQLSERGLVAEAKEDQAPKPQAGTQSSASPAAPASPPPTVPPSANGGNRRQKKAKP